MKYPFLILCCSLFSLLTAAQAVRKEDRALLLALERHVSVLAHDSMEGRRSGTPGEEKAARYIAGQMAAIGLQPRGDSGYLQPFLIRAYLDVLPATFLHIDDTPLKLGADFYPLHFSARTSLEAMPSPGLQEAGAPWFLDLSSAESGINPHQPVEEALRKAAEGAARKGATALFVYASGQGTTAPRFNGATTEAPVSIPVLYLMPPTAARYLKDESAVLDIKLKVDIGRLERRSRNVIGFIDHGGDRTVVIGAHFDHLGLGEDNNSLERGVRAVHNGADDNASGTAALLEIARLLKGSRTKGQNYLIAAFGGEELGLLGSKHFVTTLGKDAPSYMINLDMVGRLSDTGAVTVGGYGTTTLWAEAYNVKGKRAPYRGPLQFRFDSTGTGPSDHASFYRAGIPVLFFFTGLHSDYHRPTDDAGRINYAGMTHLVRHIEALTAYTAGQPKPAFLPTREVASATSARFSVTLGIVPDYAFTGQGVRVDGVTEGRPGAAAGLQKGDVIISLGNTPVRSMEEYMQALSRFRAGERTMVTWKRAGQDMNASVTF